MVFCPTYMHAKSHTLYPFEWEHGDPRTQYFTARILQVVPMGIMAVLAYCRWRLGMFEKWNW